MKDYQLGPNSRKSRRKLEIDKDLLKRKLSELKTNKEVADYFGCSQQTIRNKLKQYGLVTKSRHKRISGFSDVIKDKIIDCLSIFGCALFSQLLEYIDLDDARYASNPLKELLREKKISKTLYRGFEFYILPGNESEVKRKIRVLKFYIEETIKNHGPLRSKPLVQLIKEEFDYVVSHLMVYRLVKELVSEEKLGVFKAALNSIYFIKEDRNQELKAKQIVKNFYNKRRNFKLENVNEIFYSELDKEFVFKESEIAEWMVISKKMAPFLKIECTGRNYLDLIRTIHFMLIKKEIFLRVLKQTNIQELIPLLRLYDIIEKKNEEHFQRFSKKTYRYFIKEILNHKEFCENNLRGQILNTPDIQLKMQYTLSTIFGFDKNDITKINYIFENAVKRGYSISGRSLKGIIGGFIYYFSHNFSLGLPQAYIANKLDITEVTLRNRYREIKKLSPYSKKLNIKKSEVESKKLDELNIQSPQKIQREVSNEKKDKNVENVIYIEDDEVIDTNFSKVSHEVNHKILSKNRRFRGSFSDFETIWEILMNILSPGTVIYTLKGNKPNEIVKFGDIGITVRTEGPYKIITKILIKKAWENLVNDGILYQKDHEKSTYRSSFILTLFSQLDFVNIIREGPLCVKLDFAGLKDFEEADELNNNAIVPDLETKRTWMMKGNAFGHLEKFEEAIECYEKVIEIYPNDKEAWFSKGQVLSNQKKYKEAIECYDGVLDIDPQDKNGWYFKGLALETLEMYQQAINCYEKALEIDSGYKEAWINKEKVTWLYEGLNMADKEKYDKAIKYYDRALEIDCEYKEALYNKKLAMVRLKESKIDEKEIASQPKIINQKEIVKNEKMENEDNVFYIEDDEKIDKKALDKAHEINIQLLFELNVDGLYQSSCGRIYRYKSSLLNHFLNCPQCSNRLLIKEENGFFRCNCQRTYRYAYQFCNHIKKCHDFKNYLESLLHQDKLVRHRIRKRES